MKHYLIILMLALAACGITKKEPLKISDVPYHFRLTKDSTIVGVWGGYYKTRTYKSYGFHLFVVYSVDSLLIAPLEPYPYDSSSTPNDGKQYKESFFVKFDKSKPYDDNISSKAQGYYAPLFPEDSTLNPEEQLYQYERVMLKSIRTYSSTIYDDYIIESPFQVSRYIRPGDKSGYATELQIDRGGNLLINTKSWITGDTTRSLELKLAPYTFKTIDMQKFNQTKP